MLAFFGHDCAPVLPGKDGEVDAGINLATHYRRGQVGSHRDEAPPHLVARFKQRLDRALAERFGWAV